MPTMATEEMSAGATGLGVMMLVNEVHLFPDWL
jgi:hypothetical protein